MLYIIQSGMEKPEGALMADWEKNRRNRRHCERSEAIHSQNEEWIASSLRPSQ
jgi:hypothetical protein